MTGELTRAQKVFTMVGALLGMLLAALDQTIVSTAGPAIQRDLHIAAALYAWITTAYMVSSTVLVPIYGKLGDLYGRKRILLVAISVFLVGSLLCGVARTPAQLIAFRALQGAGSAGLFTNAFAVVADLFPPAERGKWQGLFGGVWGISSVVGPLVGGFITDTMGWNWAFFVNLPVGAVAIGLIVARMPPLRTPQVGPAALDLAGALALGVATVPLLLALSLGHAAATPSDTGWPWLSWQILGLFALSAAGAVAFVAIERRATSPILDLGLFRIRAFAIGTVATFVVGCAFLGAIVFLPLFMVNVVGVSATSAGLTTTPLTFGIVAANITSGQLVSRLGAYKGLLIGSLVVLLAAFAMLALTLDPGATQRSVTAKMVVLGVGLGPSIPLFTLAIQTAVAPPQIGVATAAATFFRQLGSTIGLAILGTMFATTFAGTLAARLPEAVRDVSPAVRAAVLARPADGENRVAFDPKRVTREVDAKLPAAEQPAAHAAIERTASAYKQAFTDGIVRVYWISLVIAVLGLAITLFLPQLPLRGKR